MFTSHHFQRHYQNCESASTPQSATSHETCLRGFGGNWSIAWTSAVSHVGCTSNAFKVTMKLQTFLFQTIVTSSISVRSLWKYVFEKFSDNLYAPCKIKLMGWLWGYKVLGVLSYYTMVVKFLLTKYLLYDFLLKYGGEVFLDKLLFIRFLTKIWWWSFSWQSIFCIISY